MWLPVAALVILVGVLPPAIAGWLADSRQSAAASARYGSTITDRLAASAVDPLLADDLIALSLLVHEFSALPEVATAAVYGADDRLLAAADGSATSPARLDHDPLAGVYISPVRLEGDIAGYARTGLLPSDRSVATAWLPGATLLAVTLLLALGAALSRLLEGRLARIRSEYETLSGEQASARGHLAALIELGTDPEGVDGPALATSTEVRPRHVLVANLFNQISLPPDARAEVLEECESALEAVRLRHGGRMESLPGTGILVALEARDGVEDSAYSAICAGLLAQRVFAIMNERRQLDGQAQLLLRIGLERIDEEASADPDAGLARSFPDSVSRGITLSALARDEGVAVSDAVLAACANPDRLVTEPLRSTALRALGGSGDAWLVHDLAPAHRGPLEREVRRLFGGD